MILQDNANWDGIRFMTTNIGGRFSYRGVTYGNEHEVLLAKLLRHLKIPFTPHVRVTLDLPNGKRRQYHPDFIFDGMPYLHTSQKTGKVEVAHGFEAKSSGQEHVGEEKQRLLREQRGINVIIIDNDSIERYYAQRYLPLVPFVPSP